MKTNIFSAGGEQLVLGIIFFGAAGARKNGTVKTSGGLRNGPFYTFSLQVLVKQQRRNLPANRETSFLNFSNS
jgi:hypothetical protein